MPVRIVFVMVNLAIALALMEGNMFAVLGKILGFYSNFAIAWVVVVATDISINKYVLKLSPKEPEYRRDMLYNVNPVGMVAFLVSAGLSIAAFFGLLGSFLAPYFTAYRACTCLCINTNHGLINQRKILHQVT